MLLFLLINMPMLSRSSRYFLLKRVIDFVFLLYIAPLLPQVTCCSLTLLHWNGVTLLTPLEHHKLHAFYVF